MFGLGFPELILILVIALIIFGPGKLPEVGKAIGKSVREFKKATNEIKREFDIDESPTTSSIPNPQPPKDDSSIVTKTENTQKPITKNPYTTVYDESKTEDKKEEKQEDINANA